MARPIVTAGILTFVTAIAGSAATRATSAAPAATAGHSAKPPAARRAQATYSGLSAPESVLYDQETDRYLVSNVAGEPLAKDGNGFISALSPDGHVIALKWIESGKNGVKLDAPKGLAIAQGLLYVADISTLRLFDVQTGAPKGQIDVPGSTSLSDVAVGSDGVVYLTDAGPPTGRLDGAGTETVYVIKGRKAKVLAKGSGLGRPDALAWTETGPVVCSFASDEIYRLDAKGEKRNATKLPAGGLSGITRAGDSLLIASWQASAIYRGKLGGAFEVALTDQKSPADIGYDTRRNRLLVPHFTEDTVEAFVLE